MRKDMALFRSRRHDLKRGALACLLGGILMATVTSVPVAAQPENEASDPLTPQALSDAVTCRSRKADQAFRDLLSSQTDPISWMESYYADESNGLQDMYAYRLDAPLAVFNQKVDTVFFTRTGVFVALPREQALQLVADEHMEQLPSKRAQQYYRSLDPQAGPVLTAFESSAPASNALLHEKLGLPHEPAALPKTLFVGCMYAFDSTEQFLAWAGGADARIDEEVDAIAKLAKQGSAGQD